MFAQSRKKLYFCNQICAHAFKCVSRTRKEDRNSEEDYDKLRLDKWPFLRYQ